MTRAGITLALVRRGTALLLSLTLLATPALAADTPLDRGAKALAAADPRTARVEFMNAIQSAPADPRPHVMLARTYLVLEDGVAAEAELRRALALKARPADTRHLLAEAALLQGASDRALAVLAEGPSRVPGAAARTKARALAALGRTDEAGASFATATRLAPRDAGLWLDVARYRLQTGARAGAIGAADRALALAPRNVAALVFRGTLVRTQYGLKAALPWFSRAAAIDETHAPAWVERAATLGDLGRTADMLAATRRALEAQPGNADARYLQAVLAARAGRFALAQSILQRVTGVAAQRPGALLLGGIVDLQLGNAQQAIDRLGALVAAQPGNLPARKLLGLAQLRSGNGRAALAALGPLETVADPYAQTLIAAAHAQAGNRPFAARVLAQATGTRGGSGLLPTNLGAGLGTSAYLWAAQVRRDLHVGSGWSARARARDIYMRNPGTPDAHLIAGDAAILTGDVEGAAADYGRAATIAFTAPTALRLVEALQMSDGPEEARIALGLFIDQNPQSLPALRLLANLRVIAGDWAGAAEAYETVRARTGDTDAALLANLAWARYETGALKAASDAAARAHAIAPRNAATADVYGWMLFKSGGDRAKALALLHRATL